MHTLIKFIKNISLFIVLALLLYIYYFLPQKVVLVFDEIGNPIEYIAKSTFFYFIIGTVLGLFLLINILNNSLKFFPLQYLKIPNKDFWFASKENKQTVLLIFQSWLFALVIIINLFLTFLALQIFSINLDNNSKAKGYLSPILWVGSIVSMMWLIFIFIRFYIKKEEIIG